LKSNCNVIYTDLVALMEYVISKYDRLLAQDKTDYSTFIRHKNHIIGKVEEVLQQLSARPRPVQKAGHGFIQATYELHQFIMQLVLDQQTPNEQKIKDMHKGLTVVHHHAKELIKTMAQAKNTL